MKIYNKGFVFTIIFSFTLLCIFYGKLLWHCNTVYFGGSTDVIQSYYSALYHINYDTSYFHTGGMNYPYGENIFFTGGYVPITTLIKFLNHFVSISGYTVGIINLSMLMSIVLCAAFIYLIFTEFSLPTFYSVMAAVGITFLSPQIQRLGIALSYEFLIPLFIYLSIRFYKNPTLKKSIVIGLCTFFALTCHLYFFSFFCFLALFYWIVLFLSHEKNFSTIGFTVKHIFLQIALPFIALSILLAITDHVHDRTQYPWGFFIYTSSWAGVFFPFRTPYEHLANFFCQPPIPDWEGVSYIGMIAVFSSFILLAILIRKVFKKNIYQLFAVTDQKLLNIFFWASVAALLYSFGYPFVWKKDFFIRYAGPLRETRALGRYAWLFFYMMNIVAFYNIYNWLKNKNRTIRYSLLGIALVLLYTDTYFYNIGHEDSLAVRIPELQDLQDNLPGDRWMKNINWTQYQAILPLPYFHVGSENISVSPESSDILKYVLIASLKSGLSTTAVSLGRTSLSQTYKNISLVLEPYKKLVFLKDLPNTKPFLVIAQPDMLNEREKHLLSKCTYLLQTPTYSLYELSCSTLQHYTDSLYSNAENEFRNAKTYLINDYYSTDSVKNFIHCSYDTISDSITYHGAGAYSGDINKFNVLYEGPIPHYKDSNYVVSFWMYNFTTDLYPRSVVEIMLKDSIGSVYRVDYTQAFRMLKALDDKWALLEQPVKIKHGSDKIKITLWNEDIWKTNPVIIDEFWLKPASINIYQEGKNYIFKNNRYYKLQ